MLLWLILALAAAEGTFYELLLENNAPGIDQIKWPVQGTTGGNEYFVAIADEPTRDLLEAHIGVHPEVYGKTTPIIRVVTVSDYYWWLLWDPEPTPVHQILEDARPLIFTQGLLPVIGTALVMSGAQTLWESGRRLFPPPGAAPRWLVRPFR